MSIANEATDIEQAPLKSSGYLFKTTVSGTYLFKYGSGAPSGTADADFYLNTASDATASTRLYANVSGTWTALNVADFAANGLTIAASKTLAVTTADKLLVGSVIVPQLIYKSFQWSIATQMVSSSLFTAERALQLVAAYEVHGVVAGQACKLLVEKCTSTTAPGSGTALLTNNTNTGFDMTATANTVQTGTLTATTADLQFAAGDRCSVKWGTSTSCVGAALSLVFQAI